MRWGSIMFCPKCSHENSEDSIYCKKCGIPIQNKTTDKKPIKRFMYSIFTIFVLITFIGLYFTLSNPFWSTSSILFLQIIVSGLFVSIVMAIKESYFKAIFYGILSAFPYLILSYLTTFPLLVPVQLLIFFIPLMGIIGSILGFYIKKKSNGRLEQKIFNYFRKSKTSEDAVYFNEIRTTEEFQHYKSKIVKYSYIFLVVFTILGTVLGYSPIYGAANTQDYPALINLLEHGSEQEQISTLMVISLGLENLNFEIPSDYMDKFIQIFQNKLKNNNPYIRYYAVYAISADLMFLTKTQKAEVISTLNEVAQNDSNSSIRNAASENLESYYDTINAFQSYQSTLST